jgi:hypothetical protein
VVIVELTALGRQSAENTPMGGLPLLRRHLSQLTQEQLIEIDSVLSEITRMMEVIEIE